MLKKLFLLAVILSLTFGVSFARADELSDIENQLQEVRKLLDESKKATEPLETNLRTIETKINGVETQINALEAEVNQKQEDIALGEKDLVKQRKIINERARNYYKQSRGFLGNLIGLFLSNNLPKSLRLYFYQQQNLQSDKNTIIKTAFFIRSLEEKKVLLEKEQEQLTVFKEELDQEKAFFQTEVAKAKDYQAGLERQIAELSARQQQLVAQRLASLNIPRSAGTSLSGCVDDRGIDPGFNPGFALFTYGVPNRTGLNQYGAKGRAEAGQDAETILRAYYENFDLQKDYSKDTNITVSDYGWTNNIEEYVKRIYEVPESWPLEALKAQAVAARSYALAYTNNGTGSICATQSCQVFKPDPKGGAWEQAVNDTAGWVMVQGGTPVKAWYSSTHGGYVLKSSEIGWSDTSWTKHAIDTTTGAAGSFSDLQGNAYDRSSPWFYCDWGSRGGYNNTAWLKSEEIADIANVILLARKDSSTGEHLYQTDKAHPYGGEVWNEDKVRQELRSRAVTPYGSVSDVSVGADFNAGKTTSVNVAGDAGNNSFSGDEFKSWFNLRAPANIQIVGPLYNVEKR